MSGFDRAMDVAALWAKLASDRRFSWNQREYCEKEHHHCIANAIGWAS